VHEIVFNNGFFSANATNGAGIGSGSGFAGTSTVGQIVFNSGSFSVSASNGAGIGPAYGPTANRTWIDYVKIAGGEFVFDGSAGIDSISLSLANASLDCSRISSTSCIRGRNIAFTAGPLIVRTPVSNFVEFGSAAFAGNPELLIEYSATSVPESLTGLPMIHIGQLEFPFPSIYKLYVCNRSFTIDSSQVRGIGFSVPSLGNYSLLYESSSPFTTGALVHDSVDSFAALAHSDTFYSSANFVPNQNSAISHDGLPCPFATLSAPAQQLSTGVVIAIVVIGIVVVLCLAILVIWRVRRARAAGSDEFEHVRAHMRSLTTKELETDGKQF
jgi:hypothetical protein